MILNIEASYERIANAIVEELPDDWQDALVTASFYSDGVDFEGEYRAISGELHSLRISMELTRSFRELRQKFKDAGQPLWGQATFVLDSRGRFDMKWGYENCDENGDAILNEEEYHRRNEERRKRLG